MTDSIVVTGIVATVPKPITAAGDLKITSFRLASTQRRFDRARDRWVDGETNWYSITTFRQLAANVAVSVMKGDRVVVSGRLRVREWENEEKNGINVDIEAEAVGHDLAFGTTAFIRVMSSSPASADQPALESEELPFPSAASLDQPLASTDALSDSAVATPF